MPFPQRENIKSFIDAARDLGVPDSDNFETGDLFEASNMKQVIVCIASLGRKAGFIDGYNGPSMSLAGSAKKNRKRTDSKVMELGSSLKLNVGAPPPCEPGSMEWMRREKEAAEAEAAAAAGGGKKGPPGKLAGREPPGLAGMLGGGGESINCCTVPACLQVLLVYHHGFFPY